MEIIEQTQEQQNATQPEQVFDADNDKWIPNPLLKKEEPKEKSEEKKTEPVDKKEDDEEEETESESEEEGEKEEEEKENAEEEEEEEEEETDDKKKEEELEESLTPDAYVAERFGDKYGLKTEADLTNIVDKALDAMDELEALKKENGTLKSTPAKAKFDNPAQQSAFEFVQQFDPTMQGEALQTFAKLIGMDIEKADPTMVLEEEFIHKNPQWTRSEAQRMFKKEYARKYTLAREKFDGSDAEFAEEEKDMDIMKRGDIAKAKTFLTDLKTKHKPAEKEQPKANTAAVEAIEKNAKTYGDYIEKQEEVVFGEGDDKYGFKLDAEKKKLVSEAWKGWVRNPASYNEKGELQGAGTPEEMLYAIVGGLFLKDVVNSLKSRVSNKVKIERVEEIGKNKPKKRVDVGSGETKGNADNLDEQAMELIRKKKAA